MTAQTHNANGPIDALAGAAGLLGRSRIAYLSSKFYADPMPGPLETASILALHPALAADFIRVANTVQYGGGIPVLNVEAATVRLGADRTRSLALASEITQVLAATIADAIDFGDFWRRSLIRGSIARALAMNADRRLAGEAFLVGLLQDVGAIILAAAEPQTYSELTAQSGGCPLQLAALEWNAFRVNHIHTGLRLLREWQLPAAIVDAVGRHHTNPPLSPAMSPAMRLWQIGYVAGAIHLGPATSTPTSRPLLLRLLRSAFHIQAGAVSALIDQASGEYRDVEGLFDKFFAVPVDVTDLLASASTLAMDAASPSIMPPTHHPARDFAPVHA